MLSLLLLSLLSSSSLSPYHIARAHDEPVHGALPARWYHPQDHAVHALFARDGSSPVGPYPPLCQQGAPSTATADIPARWMAAYTAASNAGLIPAIPQTTQTTPTTDPVYPAPYTNTDPRVCSNTGLKCFADDDVHTAPPGVLAVSFDDGPLLASPTLYSFLEEHQIPSTHFMIGCEILGTPSWFDQAFSQNHASIAVHTWTHPYLTTLTDLQVLTELGWSMQIISDLTGGRVPRFWRPPHGDADSRVRAIAKEVFGLTNVVWNQDSEDWRLSSGYPGASVSANLTAWVSGDQSKGLVILEHELTPDTVNFFINTTYPLAVQHKWTLKSIPDIVAERPGAAYQNAQDDLAAVSPSSVGLVVTATPVSHTPQLSQTQPSSGASSGSGGSTGTSGGSSAATTAATDTGTKKSPGAHLAPATLALVCAALLAGFAAA